MPIPGRFSSDFVISVQAISRKGICISVLIEAQYMEGGGRDQGFEK